MNFSWPELGNSLEISDIKVRKAIRQSILEAIYAAKSGHPGGSLSLVEILAAIFDGNFVQDPKDPEKKDRDRLVLSKGHGVPALYAWYSFLGYFPAAELTHLRQFGHFLQGHPDRQQFSLMEASTGSLGQGVSVALGLAMGLNLAFERKELQRRPHVYAILGDGEMQEGQVWESLMAGGKFRPSNLTFILDANKGQIDGPTAEVMNLEPIVDKVKSFGWLVERTDGHDVEKLKKILSQKHESPLFIVADTVKGKGVSFMENQMKWHGSAPNREQLEQALQEVVGPSFPYGRLAST